MITAQKNYTSLFTALEKYRNSHIEEQIREPQSYYSDSEFQEVVNCTYNHVAILEYSRITDEQKEDLLSKGYYLSVLMESCFAREPTRSDINAKKRGKLIFKDKKLYLYKVTIDKPNMFCIVCAESVYDVQNILSTNAEYSRMSCIEIGEANKDQIRGILVAST